MAERVVDILDQTTAGVPDITERELVGRAKLGNESALAGLYRRYHPRVYSYILARTPNQHVAEDLTQDVFLKLIESIPAFEQRGVPFSAWVFRIAHNHIVSKNRKGGKKKSYVFSDVSIAEFESFSSDDPEEYAEAKDTLDKVLKVISQLPPLQRDVLTLRFIADLGVAETAHVIGKSTGNIKCAQYRGISNLRKRLNQNGLADMLQSSIGEKAV